MRFEESQVMVAVWLRGFTTPSMIFIGCRLKSSRFHNLLVSLSVQFGKRIRQIRQEKGLSQEGLAAQSGLHRTYIGAVERGEKNISLSNIARLASALDVSIEHLFQGIQVTSINID